MCVRLSLAATDDTSLRVPLHRALRVLLDVLDRAEFVHAEDLSSTDTASLTWGNTCRQRRLEPTLRSRFGPRDGRRHARLGPDNVRDFTPHHTLVSASTRLHRLRPAFLDRDAGFIL